MNILLFSLAFFVVVYIMVTTFMFVSNLVFTASFFIAGSTLANHYGGQSALLLVLVLSPVLYVAVTDLVGTLKSAKLPMISMNAQIIEKQHDATALVEAAPVSGEWISGKTPAITFQQPLIGDVKALPKPWL